MSRPPIDNTPRAMIQRTGAREWGPGAWRAWVNAGLTCYQREDGGPYAWTREGAERKARKLLSRYIGQRLPPAEEVARHEGPT